MARIEHYWPDSAIYISYLIDYMITAVRLYVRSWFLNWKFATTFIPIEDTLSNHQNVNDMNYSVKFKNTLFYNSFDFNLSGIRKKTLVIWQNQRIQTKIPIKEINSLTFFVLQKANFLFTYISSVKKSKYSIAVPIWPWRLYCYM